MSKRAEQAVAYHKKGYNCAQSVACSFTDLISMDEDTLFRVIEGFGGGMGGMQGACGAVSGAVTITGLLRSEGKEQCKSKAQTYKLSKKVVSEFKEKNQSIICEDLKGIHTKKPLRACDDCIADAVEILENILEEAGIETKS